MAARAATETELAQLRRDGQWSRLFLAIHNPAAVYTARLAAAPASNDQVVEIAITGGSGTLGDVLPDMTLWVGSSAGAYDKGQCRIRLAPSGATFYIAETSDVAWATNDYLTVVDEFGLWARHMRKVDTTYYVDWDVAYSDQHATPEPVPVLGPPAVLWLTGATVSVGFDASASWRVGGGALTYAWAAPGASATSGLATATPTFTYNAAGTYRVACTVTGGGKSHTGYRYIFVYTAAAPPVTQFKLESSSGDWQSGWTFRVTLYAEAGLAAVRDRALVILFAEDWYGSEQVSLGPVAGRENIIALGWIAAETLTRNPEQASVSFDVTGPHYWLGQIAAFPVGVEDIQTTPTAWTNFQDLTTDKGLWAFLRWRSTATRCIDLTLTGDARGVAALDAPLGNLWQQLQVMAQATLLAAIHCDRYGRLYVEIDPQYIPAGSRTAPVVQDLTAADWRDSIAFGRVTVSPVALLELSGVYYTAGVKTPYISLAEGYAPRRYGSAETVERVALSDQAQTNELCGLVMGQRNNAYPQIPIALASNHRLVDSAPAQYLRLSLAAADTPRGVAFTDMRLIVRRVTITYNPESGLLLTDVETEAETFATLAVTKPVPPLSAGDNAPGGDEPAPGPTGTPDLAATVVYVVRA